MMGPVANSALHRLSFCHGRSKLSVSGPLPQNTDAKAIRQGPAMLNYRRYTEGISMSMF